MKKAISGKKLSRTTNERKQLFRNLVKSIVDYGFVLTTLAKAQAVRPNLEKLVSRAKKSTLADLRRLIQYTGNVETARKLMIVGNVFSKRPGGYTRMVRLDTRKGDNTQMVRLEWSEKVTMPEKVKLEKKTQETSQKLKQSKPKTETNKKKLPEKTKKT